MLYLNMDIDGLSLSQIKVIKKLAYHAESQLDRLTENAVSQGWSDSTINALRDQADQCGDLWDKCVKALAGA